MRSGDLIELDVTERRLDLLVEADEITRRLAAGTRPSMPYRRGYGWLFSQHVLQADKGCDFDFLRAEVLPPGSTGSAKAAGRTPR